MIWLENIVVWRSHLLFVRRESGHMTEDEYLGKIWIKCEHAKKFLKNGRCQNIQTNTCKNEAGKPVFMRVPRGYCRNRRSPFRALKQTRDKLIISFQFVEIEGARLGRWNTLWRSDRNVPEHRRNRRSPFRALKQFVPFWLSACALVEIEGARLGRWNIDSWSSFNV